MYRVTLRRVSLRKSAPTSLLMALLNPREDGTLDHFLTYGQGSPVFNRDSTGLVRDWEGNWQSIAADTPRWQGARYSFAGAVVHPDLADGTPLHPTRTVTHEGVDLIVFDHYRTRANSVSYAVGTRIIPADGGGTAGGNGFWYEVTVEGETGASPPTFPTTADQTVADGTATLRCGGYYRIDGIVLEPTRTNLALHSRDFGNAAWIKSAAAAQDETGIDGQANTAWTLTDSSGTATQSAQQNITITSSTNAYVGAVRVKKDADETRVVGFRFRVRQGTEVSHTVRLNTVTGASGSTSTGGGGSYTIIDDGLWWVISVTVTDNASGNTLCDVTVYPAIGTVVGSSASAATGSAVIGQVDVRANATVIDSPIFTAGSAVSRDADTLTIPKAGNFNDASGLLLADYRPANWANPAGYIVGDAAGYVLKPTAANSGAATFDGTNTATGPEGTPANMVRASAQWGSGVMSVSANGAVGAEVAYDGSFDLAGNVPIGSGYQGTVRNLRAFK